MHCLTLQETVDSLKEKMKQFEAKNEKMEAAMSQFQEEITKLQDEDKSLKLQLDSLMQWAHEIQQNSRCLLHTQFQENPCTKKKAIEISKMLSLIQACLFSWCH